MTIHAIKLTDEKTILELDDETGWLFESGGNFPRFHRSAEDTFRILQLLSEHIDAIQSGKDRERYLQRQ